ncbi:transient receptor potential cation channel subfamily M member 4-like [Liolophura sinensis]|uniref:transient receptor potential cation channel subfamily M member 4-like n=1 Tax=Liolophura sinensis TaxID=3198878 RepID=UPI00315814A2
MSEKVIISTYDNLKDVIRLRKLKKTESPRIRLYGLTTLKNAMGKMVFPKLPLHKQLYYLWNAPITKFWVNQVLLFAAFGYQNFLGSLHKDLKTVLHGLPVSVHNGPDLTHLREPVPGSDSVYLDWDHPGGGDANNICEKTEIPRNDSGVPSTGDNPHHHLPGVYLFVRIIPHFVVLTGISYQFTDYQSAKFVMSLGLLYFYYRLLAVSFPISPTLGPMLINIKRMIKKDFFTWFRMFLLFMISGAITIQAVIYPNYPFTWEMLRKAFSRALFALFLTQIHDLEGDPVCTADYPNATLDFCGKELREPLISPCPYGGNVTYLIVIQYLFIVKLVLVTLLFAMFSSTISKISAESQQIWKFQRYNLIVEFEERLRLPPPLTLISYLSCWRSWCGRVA